MALLLCVLSLLLTACSPSGPRSSEPVAYQVTDVEGTVTAFSAPPKRIVT